MNNNKLIEKLQAGETVKFRPKGSSMEPKIKSGALVTVEPCADINLIKTGDVVYCKVRGKVYLHLVSAKKDNHLQISNNHGFCNGWTSTVYGKLTNVEK